MSFVLANYFDIIEVVKEKRINHVNIIHVVSVFRYILIRIYKKLDVIF
nr:MAG TPA: hypothetical protein [Bacteriophage sp.]